MRTPALIVVALLLAACSSSGGAPAKSSAAPATTAAPSSTSSAPSSAPPSTVDTAAELRQWGGLVASLERPVLVAQAKIKNCTSLDYGTQSPGICTLGRLGLTFTTETFALDFKDQGDDLGGLPAELTSLVVATQTDALAMDGLQKGIDRNCSQIVTQRCAAALSAWDQGRDDLIADFDKWRPYTN